MKIKDYLPEFLQDIREFVLIGDAEDIEFEKIETQISKQLDEVIVRRADSYGLKRYEKIYNITDIESSVEARRINILNKMNNKVPYTIIWLQNKLNNIVGEENYIIKMDYDKYSLNIQILAIFKNIAKVLEKDLREALPANIKVSVELFQTEECNCYIAGIIHTGEYMEIS